MTVIENLLVANVDTPAILLSRLPIRDSSVVSSLTSLCGMVSCGRRKGERNKTTVGKIKNLLTDYGNPTQQILTIKAILKDSMSSEQSDQVGIINTEQDFPIIYLFSQVLIPSTTSFPCLGAPIIRSTIMLKLAEIID